MWVVPKIASLKKSVRVPEFSILKCLKVKRPRKYLILEVISEIIQTKCLISNTVFWECQRESSLEKIQRRKCVSTQPWRMNRGLPEGQRRDRQVKMLSQLQRQNGVSLVLPHPSLPNPESGSLFWRCQGKSHGIPTSVFWLCGGHLCCATYTGQHTWKRKQWPLSTLSVTQQGWSFETKLQVSSGKFK